MINKELADYIASHRQQGRTDEELKHHLMTHGYSAEQADVALKHANHTIHNDNNEQHKSSKKKGDVPTTQYAIVTIVSLLIVLLTPVKGIFVAIAIVAGLGWLLKVRIPRRLVLWIIFYLYRFATYPCSNSNCRLPSGPRPI